VGLSPSFAREGIVFVLSISQCSLAAGLSQICKPHRAYWLGFKLCRIVLSYCHL
jgi:hypothetical protein